MADPQLINGRRILAQEINVEVPGFEGCKVVFDLMATEDAVDRFIRRMGGPDGPGGEPTHKGVVLEVINWPAEFAGIDPWDRARSPMAFRAWVSRAGWGGAVKAFITDPNA
jgi:hypothetical protein